MRNSRRILALSSKTSSVIDSFNRTDSATLGTTDTRQTWENGIAGYGSIGIVSNKAQSVAATGSAAAVACGFYNGSITIVASSVVSNSGFMFRYKDSQNYCEFTYGSSSSIMVVSGKLSNSYFGGFTAGYYLSSITISNGDTIKMTMSGNTIEFFVNSVSKGTLTIAQNASETKHGIKLYSATANFDSFRFDAP